MTNAPPIETTAAPGLAPRVLAGGFILFAGFAVVTGCADVLLGPRLLGSGGAALGIAARDPWLGSQLRFMGGMWAGWGVLMLWTCPDLRTRQPVFDILCAVLFVAGCGRTTSVLTHLG